MRSMFHCDVSWWGVQLMSQTTTALVSVHVKFTLNVCLKTACQMHESLIRQLLNDIQFLSVGEHMVLPVW